MFPRWQRALARSDADAGRMRRSDLGRRERSQLFDHGAHGELASASARGWPVAVDEKELVDSVGRRCQEITAQSEKVPIARVQTGDRATSHALDLMSDRDARNGCATDVVVGDQE